MGANSTYSDSGANPAVARTLLPPLSLGCFLLIVCYFTLTFPGSQGARFTRLFLSPFALWAFWDFGFGHFLHYDPLMPVTVYTVLGSYGPFGLLRTIEAFFLMADDPPRWVSLQTGEVLPLPEDLSGRIGYALDLFATIRGLSWFRGRRWDFALPRLAEFQSPHSRATFAIRRIALFALCYLAADAVDACIKAIPFDLTSSRPVTSAPLTQQLVCVIGLSLWTLFGMEIYLALLSAICVGFGLTSSSAWPPLFDSPFLATSIQDFWGNRWHHVYRQSFVRFATSITSLFLGSNAKANKGIGRVAKIILVFLLSALLHVSIIARHPQNPALARRGLLDWSTIFFFFGQPVGMGIDICIVYLGAGTTWRRIFTWVWFPWTARWWADAYVKTGLLGGSEPFISWSPVRGILFGNWYPEPVVP
ncbi:hypothetical protein BS47DRAFT_1331843 [Hydnum rufescens UP504]|uniref:Wax synthase domain-containing protein n=1 Tax=Hydnum rufescens UP504 TaxID=1448309 RepID=A0A9P6AQT6_9AGAM|nr:hypothetical protein BS47DRAFT_1331843 [Hydnum rufescens UP504]